MAQQQQRPAAPPRRPMTNKEVEQYLDAQYARMLQDTPAAALENRGVSEDIQDSLQMLASFNRVSLQIKRTAQRLPFFS